ncbi:5'-methylthioadenosine nucleosidase [Chlamydiifrater volucris]|uniref:5'-methylthioadenosine/S-adenosylhomocysteine nucleosidase family protein n=1 Tax=Chlamydiifrater volucris TaxID=2681470 RepID=UPI001BCDD96A|nr:5'-methylthioadenosine nucleosidase [Chlamydiifrater volucris]
MKYYFLILALLTSQGTPSVAAAPTSVFEKNSQLKQKQSVPLKRIGIIFSFPDIAISQENLSGRLFPWLTNVKQSQEGNRTYFSGNYLGKQVIVSFLWPTKVGAAITASHMILKQGVDIVLIIGSCYSRDPKNHLFDVLVPRGYIHHDADLRPMLNKFETPDNQVSIFQTSPMFFHSAKKGSKRFLELEKTNIENLLKRYGFIQHYTDGLHTVKEGIIATGEPFSLSRKYFLSLQKDLPEITGFDNSGCAIAQVCHEYEIPCLGINIIEPHPIEAPNQESWAKILKEIRVMYAQNLVGLLLEEIIL